MNIRILRFLSISAIAGIVVGSILAYPTLPERFATHFDFRGVPDGWGNRSPVMWFTLPAIAVSVYLVMEWTAWYVGRNPHRINLPDRRKVERLPPAGKSEVARLTQVFLHATNLALAILFASLAWGMYAMASGAERLPMPSLVVLYVVLFGSIASAAFFVWFVSSRADQLHRNVSDADAYTS